MTIMANQYGRVAIQDLVMNDRLGAGDITITYVGGGVAGSESVSVTGHAITVTIEEGTSTANQIRTALEANTAASALITPSGVSTSAQYAGNEVPLSGGVTEDGQFGQVDSAVAASRTVGNILYTAATAGRSGNDITIQYQEDLSLLTGSGTLGVSVSSNDITLSLAPSGLWISNIIQGVADDADASGLVGRPASAGSSPTKLQYAAAASTALALQGGQDLTPPSGLIQGLNYVLSYPSGTVWNDTTVSFTDGVVASGSEVATLDTHAISVSIDDNESNAAGVKTALEANSDIADRFNFFIQDGGQKQRVVKDISPSGAIAGVGGDPLQYTTDEDTTALTTNWAKKEFGFLSNGINIANDAGSGIVEYSFDGITVDGRIAAGKDDNLTGRQSTAVYMRYATDEEAFGHDYNVTAWVDRT